MNITTMTRPNKRRYNVSLYPDVVANMDNVADYLHCSRSDFIESCFFLWLTMNPEVADELCTDFRYGVELIGNE